MFNFTAKPFKRSAFIGQKRQSCGGQTANLHFAWNPLDTHFFSVYTNHNNEKRRPVRDGFGDNDEQQKVFAETCQEACV